MNNPESPKPAEPRPGQEPVQYETGKGCLMFVLVGVVLVAAMVGAVIVFGIPA